MCEMFESKCMFFWKCRCNSTTDEYMPVTKIIPKHEFTVFQRYLKILPNEQQHSSERIYSIFKREAYEQ